LRAVDLRIEALERTLRRARKERKRLQALQTELIRKIDESSLKPQLPVDVLSEIFAIDIASGDTYWPPSKFKEICETFDPACLATSVIEVNTNGSEDCWADTHPARLFVTHVAFNTPKGEHERKEYFTNMVDRVLCFKERWHTLKVSYMRSFQEFLDYSPAFPYLECIDLEGMELEADLLGTSKSSNIRFNISIPSEHFPRRLKSTFLEFKFLVPFRDFISHTSSLSISNIPLFRLQIFDDIFLYLPNCLTSLTLHFRDDFRDPTGCFNKTSKARPPPTIRELKLVNFKEDNCLGILAHFGGSALQRLILEPYELHGEFAEVVIQGIDELFPSLSFLGVESRGVWSIYGDDEGNDGTNVQGLFMAFVYRSVALICGGGSKGPLLKNLEGIEIPFPFPCAFDCVRDGLARRRFHDVREIRQLVMRPPVFPANPNDHPLHEYFAQFVESLQFVVKEVVVVGMGKCPDCQTFFGHPPLPVESWRLKCWNLPLHD